MNATLLQRVRLAAPQWAILHLVGLYGGSVSLRWDLLQGGTLLLPRLVELLSLAAGGQPPKVSQWVAQVHYTLELQVHLHWLAVVPHMPFVLNLSELPDKRIRTRR